MSSERESVLTDAKRNVTRLLVHEFGVSEIVAVGLAEEWVTAPIRDKFGGRSAYIHARQFPAEELRTRVLAEFTGDNRDELIAKYGISRSRLYQILQERPGEESPVFD